MFYLSLSLLSLFLFPSLVLSSKSFLSPRIFFTYVSIFPHPLSPYLHASPSSHHFLSNHNSGSSPVASTLSHTLAWDQLHED